MRRKVIKQGGHSLSIHLPKKWAGRQGLRPGAEVDVVEEDDALTICVPRQKGARRKIEIVLEDGDDAVVRPQIENAYRSGYDIILACYGGPEKIIRGIVADYLIGFDVLADAKNKYSLESVAEPGYENFEPLIKRQFLILGQMIEGIDEQPLEDLARSIKKYDNFLKRCIAKKILGRKGEMYLWQLLGTLVQASRHAYHIEQHRGQIPLSKGEVEFREEILAMLAAIRRAYAKRDSECLCGITGAFGKLYHVKGLALLQKGDPVRVHFLLSLARAVYVLHSPVLGLVGMESATGPFFGGVEDS